MSYPPLLRLQSENEYRLYFENNYCQKEIYTFDGIRVFFPKEAFNHAFFDSGNRRKKDKSVFSRNRAERLSWISVVLWDDSAELYFGWDNKRKCVDYNRRVTIVKRDYVVIIKLRNKKKAFFITAFIATQQTLNKIRLNPKWEKESR